MRKGSCHSRDTAAVLARHTTDTLNADTLAHSRSHRRSIRPRVVGLLAALCALPTFASPQSATGAIEGRVIDGVTGQPLPGATVLIDGSSIATSTDRGGNFRITGVETGD